MGSSAKKKKEKQKDFKKPKLKVGKTKPKASNFTDTSFKSKAIVMAQQSLSADAPDAVQQFRHNLSLASSSRSDKQRRDALSYLTSQLSSEPSINPVGSHGILTKLLPLISDSSTPVRSQLLKVLQALPEGDIKHSVEQAILFIRAGMTHLSADISNDSLGFLEWLLDVADDELVACPGGWVKTLNTFCATMGWTATSLKAGWSSGSRAGMKTKNAQTYGRQLAALSRFLQAGFKEETAAPQSESQYWDNLYRIPRAPNAFDYLNLSGARRAGDDEMCSNREARQQAFRSRFWDPVSKGADQAKSEGGSTGRAAASLDQVLKKGMGDYEDATAMEKQDLLDLW